MPYDNKTRAICRDLRVKNKAFKIAAWISTEFELYIIKDYQRLKTDENSHISLDWNVKMMLNKSVRLGGRPSWGW